MPYTEAVILEGLRLFMGHTFGIPHRALRDTKLGGFDIPKVKKYKTILPTINNHFTYSSERHGYCMLCRHDDRRSPLDRLD